MCPNPKPRPKRNRGGQPGNKNALKTGFYSRCYRPADIADLADHEFKGLEDEITLLRVYIRRLLEQVDEAKTFQDHLALMRALSLASVGLTRLLKVEKDVFGSSHTLMDEISRITAEIQEERGEPDW